MIPPDQWKFVNYPLPTFMYPEVTALVAARLHELGWDAKQALTPAPAEEPRHGFPRELVERAVRDSVDYMSRAWELLASMPGAWVSTDEVRAAVGFTKSEHQVPGMFGAFKTRLRRVYGRDDSPIETVKRDGVWHYRITTDTAEIVRRVRTEIQGTP